MKTLDIVMIAAGVGIVGYLAYKNKDQFNKPLTDADNEPLRAGFDTGTNNGNGYQTEEEKPASDPVVLSKPALLPFTEVSVKNAVEKTDNTFETGEQPSVAVEPKKTVSEFFNNPLPIPKFNTTTPYSEEPSVLKPLVAEVSPSAPVVSITDTQEQPTTLLYNNRERNIAPETYDYGMAYRDEPVNSYQYVE